MLCFLCCPLIVFQNIQGCLCSSSGNHHDEAWTFECEHPETFLPGLRQAMDRRPKWTLVSESGGGDDNGGNGNSSTIGRTLRCDRRTDMHGFIDNLALDVRIADRVVTIEARSRCGNPKHTFDWGQNKRNLAQLRTAVMTTVPGVRLLGVRLL